MRHCTLVSIVVASLVFLVSTLPLAAQQSEFPSVNDSPEPTIDVPSEKTIQKAVMRCLTVVDANQGGRVRGQGAGLVEEGEETYCFQQKKACKADPSSFSCRSFVKDYVKDDQVSKTPRPSK